MITATTSKSVSTVFPQARLNNASFTAAAVDRHGFDYATLELSLGATDVALTALKLQESDDNNTFTDIPGADFSTSATLPTSSSSNTLWAWDIDLRARKRYLKPVITVGTGSAGAFASATFKLFRAEQMPYNASTRNVAGLLTV